VPIVESFHVPDLLEVEVGPWERKGSWGHFPAARRRVCQQLILLEIPPSGQTTVQRHMYEELIYVIKGRGATTVWNGRGARTSFEWSVGSFFAIPPQLLVSALQRQRHRSGSLLCGHEALR